MVIRRDYEPPALKPNRIVVRESPSALRGFNQIVGEDAAKYLLGQLNEGEITPKVSGIYQVVVTLRADRGGNIEVISLKIR